MRNQDFTVLFRVNYQWQDRDFARNPAVIFTADPDLPPQNTEAMLVFPTRPDANRILWTHCLRRRPPRQGYAVFPELVDTGSWDFRPTNGALMIAAAVALQPKKIVVAGIDLYRHPAGKYPGDARAPNAYDAMHSRATDVAFIRAALARFDGELVLLGEELPRAVS